MYDWPHSGVGHRIGIWHRLRRTVGVGLRAGISAVAAEWHVIGFAAAVIMYLIAR